MYQRHCTTRFTQWEPVELSDGVVHIFGASKNIPQVIRDVKGSTCTGTLDVLCVVGYVVAFQHPILRLR